MDATRQFQARRARQDGQQAPPSAPVIRPPPKPDRRSPPETDRTAPPPRPQAPPARPQPFPMFLVAAVSFIVLLFLMMTFDYFSETYWYLGLFVYPFMVLAAIIVIYSLYGAVAFNIEHRIASPERCKVATIACVAVLIAGSVTGGIVFAYLEPYSDWSYSAELHCTAGCVADLPVPLKEKGSNRTFFNEMDVRTKGQGYVVVIQQEYDGKKVPALRVYWSGDLTVNAGNAKDYRPLPNGRNGLYNASKESFVAFGQEIPTDGNATVHIEFRHERFSQVHKLDKWTLEGPLGEGLNLLTAED